MAYNSNWSIHFRGRIESSLWSNLAFYYDTRGQQLGYPSMSTKNVELCSKSIPVGYSLKFFPNHFLLPSIAQGICLSKLQCASSKYNGISTRWLGSWEEKLAHSASLVLGLGPPWNDGTESHKYCIRTAFALMSYTVHCSVVPSQPQSSVLILLSVSIKSVTQAI